MTSETIGEYEMEYTGVALPEGKGWGAWLTIYGPSANPMHRNEVFRHQRVSVETAFPNEREAAAAARKVGAELLRHR